MGRQRKASVKLPPHVHAVVARAKQYFYFHPWRGTEREGDRVKLPGYPFHIDGTPNNEWWETYRRCAGDPVPKAKAGTFAALIEAYRNSPEWRELSSASQRDYARYLDYIHGAWGKLQVAGVEPRHVLAIRDSKAGTPAAANFLVRTLSALISWGIPRGFRTDNPCRHVRKLRIGEATRLGRGSISCTSGSTYRGRSFGGRRPWRFIRASGSMTILR